MQDRQRSGKPESADVLPVLNPLVQGPGPGYGFTGWLMNNTELRRHAQASRSLSPTDHARRSRALARHTTKLLYRGASGYTCFLSADGEIDTGHLAHPRVAKRLAALPGEPILRFRQYQPGMPMRSGDFGILEPAAGPVGALEVDVVLTPLVAFDDQGFDSVWVAVITIAASPDASV